MASPGPLRPAASCCPGRTPSSERVGERPLEPWIEGLRSRACALWAPARGGGAHNASGPRCESCHGRAGSAGRRRAGRGAGEGRRSPAPITRRPRRRSARATAVIGAAAARTLGVRPYIVQAGSRHRDASRRGGGDGHRRREDAGHDGRRGAACARRSGGARRIRQRLSRGARWRPARAGILPGSDCRWASSSRTCSTMRAGRCTCPTSSTSPARSSRSTISATVSAGSQPGGNRDIRVKTARVLAGTAMKQPVLRGLDVALVDEIDSGTDRRCGHTAVDIDAGRLQQRDAGRAGA